MVVYYTRNIFKITYEPIKCIAVVSFMYIYINGDKTCKLILQKIIIVYNNYLV